MEWTRPGNSAGLLAALPGGLEEADRSGGRGVERGHLAAGRDPHDQITSGLGEGTEAPFLAPDDEDQGIGEVRRE